ncbi:RNA recognition motif [Gracilaria domingensis]|nr:RNA recognition motif [Gracilaria domingensis]
MTITPNKPHRATSKKSPRVKSSTSAKSPSQQPTTQNSSATKRGENDGSKRSAEAASPQVVINKEITEDKLKLLEQSPLRRLVPEEDRKAAAAELRAKRKGRRKSVQVNATPSSSKDEKLSKVGSPATPQTEQEQQNEDTKEPHVPDSDAQGAETQQKTRVRQNLDDIKLGVAKKNEARKMRWKVRKLRKDGKLAHTDKDLNPGVLYLGHIPHGFYEKEMRSYFSQFGEVLRLRLSRSAKTARSRGYAFIEFAHKEVAQIAADAMDGYLMHKQKLVARFVPPEKIHADTFKGANRTFRQIPWSRIERRNMLTRAKDPMKLAARSKRILKSAKKKQKSLVRQGLAHSFLELPRGP